MVFDTTVQHQAEEGQPVVSEPANDKAEVLVGKAEKWTSKGLYFGPQISDSVPAINREWKPTHGLVASSASVSVML
jgi:hypothetical protein